MIIQGGNAPIVLTFNEDISKTREIYALLYTKDRELKSWKKSDLQVRSNEVTLPLTEAETAGFPEGKAFLEVKWLDLAFDVQHAKTMTLYVAQKQDKRLLT